MSSPLEARVSAPGKLYLFGEYAVLAGGWSVVAAVDRRVTGERRAAPGTYTARGLETDDDELVRAVLEEVEAATGRSFEPGHFATDATAMYEGGTKLGLGSSAASAVALTAAAMAEEETEVASQVFRRRALDVAERAHEAFQSGIGSGASIPAASLGGVLACRRRAPTAEFGEIETELALDETESTERFVLGELRVPPEVEIRAYWLGQPASTTDFVRRVLQRMQIRPAEVYRKLRGIARIAERAIEACRAGEPSAFVEALDEGDAAMGDLGEECGIPVVVEDHWRLREASETCGVAVKPSGAGGGDFSLAAGRSDADWAGFEDALPAGVRPVEVEFGDVGVE